MRSFVPGKQGRPLEIQSHVRELVERLNQGETKALSEIWNIFGDHIRRRARTRLREFGIAGKAESMDICNNVLLDMVKQESIRIQNPNEILAYFCKAVDNQIRTIVRALLSEKRDIRREINLENTQVGIDSPVDSPSVGLIQSELMEMVAGALGEQGDEFVRMFLANHSWQEIADRFRCTPDSARMKWNRAVVKIRSQLTHPTGGNDIG
ncbi:MAG: ECF-type sigma factor [Pirellulaceae bacterium]